MRAANKAKLIFLTKPLGLRRRILPVFPAPRLNLVAIAVVQLRMVGNAKFYLLGTVT
jgi:hypothetical protein